MRKFPIVYSWVAVAMLSSLANCMVTNDFEVNCNLGNCDEVSNKQFETSSWALDRIDQNSTELDGKYKYQSTGKGVTAYIIDGDMQPHKEFSERFVDVVDFYGEGLDECQNHGTAMASLVGGKDFGVAKKVSLVSVKVAGCQLDQDTGTYGMIGSPEQMVEGIRWVMENAVRPAVVNISFSEFNPLSRSGEPFSGDTTVYDALTELVDSGIVAVVAAGNKGADACDRSQPRVEGAITVGSVDENDSRSEFSNFGPCVDIFAPGEDVRVASNVTRDGMSGWVSSNGTSISSALVTGQVAKILEENPGATVQEVKTILYNSSISGMVSNRKGGADRILFAPWN